MHTTLVINSKGGSGKTTIATNLASYFASQGLASALMDYDPQGSSLNWLEQRSPYAPRIYGANAVQPRTGLRSLRMQVPASVRELVIDAPAGASGLLLQELLRKADSLLIPVQPSSIDIHATAGFIRDLLLAGKLRLRNVRLGVIANRVRRASSVYQPLERFLASLELPFLTRVSDSEVFVEAAESGTGIFEMDAQATAAEREQFLPIVEWVGSAYRRPESNVITLSRPAWSGRIA